MYSIEYFCAFVYQDTEARLLKGEKQEYRAHGVTEKLFANVISSCFYSAMHPFIISQDGNISVLYHDSKSKVRIDDKLITQSIHEQAYE
jgi:hypothetical protein